MDTLVFGVFGVPQVELEKRKQCSAKHPLSLLLKLLQSVETRFFSPMNLVKTILKNKKGGCLLDDCLVTCVTETFSKK